ncbi:diguanylate cyclase [Alteromonas sp. D210916BOD_24]
MKRVRNRWLTIIASWAALLVIAPAYAYNENTVINGQLEEVTYCIDPNWAPYESIHNGKHIGISAQYMALIEELASLKFSLVPTDSWQQSLSYVQQGKCQVIPMLNTSDYRKQFLDFSLPYFEAPNVLVAKTGMPMLQGYAGIGNRTVGIVQGYRQVEYISRYYPSLRLKLVASEEEGLQQLAKGEFDVLVGSIMSVNMHINNLNLKDLVIVGYAEPFDSLAFGVNKSYGHLVDKLNYAIEHIPERQKVEIYKKWNNVQIRYARNYTVMLLSVVIVLLVLFWLIARKRCIVRYNRIIKQKNDEIGSLQANLLEKNKTLAFLSAHDKVTGLYNRNHMIQRAEEEISRFHRFHTTASLIVIELTSINNDVASSLVGKEEALKAVAASCLDTVREVDVVSRFTGEQFIILCPQTELASSKHLADRLMACMLGHRLLSTTFKIAMGMSELREDEEFTDWFERTNKALFQSKRLGYGVVSVAEG